MPAGVLGQHIGRAMHTPHSAARAAGVTKSAIYKAIKSGRLPASKLDGGSYAIYPAELRRVFQLHRFARAADGARPDSFSFPKWDVG